MFRDDHFDPENQKFKYPDFGFVDKLNVDTDDQNSLWRMLFFHVSCNPKYERLHNLIQVKTAEKHERESKIEIVPKKRTRKYNRDGKYESIDSNENSFDKSTPW
tara:strand:- start:53 stop:364 length:312 start_codon:yes stop_codon:yes gene_type:complete